MMRRGMRPLLQVAQRQVLDAKVRRHIHVNIRHSIACRDMNATTSQEVFAGPYLTAAGPEVRRKFGDAFIDMTVGFLAFPLCLPGTAVWRGRRGRLYILSVLRVAAAQSKAAMKARCIRTVMLLVSLPSAPFCARPLRETAMRSPYLDLSFRGILRSKSRCSGHRGEFLQVQY